MTCSASHGSKQRSRHIHPASSSGETLTEPSTAGPVRGTQHPPLPPTPSSKQLFIPQVLTARVLGVGRYFDGFLIKGLTQRAHGGSCQGYLGSLPGYLKMCQSRPSILGIKR